jgi:hypothetical protein
MTPARHKLVLGAAAAIAAVMMTGVPFAAQAVLAQAQAPAPQGAAPQAPGPQGGRGRGAAGPPATARAIAPVDLTGVWVAVVNEDWRWRMITPPKGDYASVPLNDEGVRVANAWDPARDQSAGEQCRAYGAGGIMRQPGRLRLSWADDQTLRLEFDAGTQTRLLHFATVARGERSWQGHAVAAWQNLPGRGRGNAGAAGPRALKVETTNLRPGYLRPNGVPYSADAVVTEYLNRIDPPGGDSWLIVTTIVEDPRYLNQRFLTSAHFKRENDDSRWAPTPCVAG